MSDNNWLRYKEALETGAYLTPGQLMEKYSASRSFVYKLLETETKLTEKFGRRVLVDIKKLRAYIENHDYL